MRLSTSARQAALALIPLGLIAAGAATAADLNRTDTITYPGSVGPGVTVTTTSLTNAPITPDVTFTLGHTLSGGLQNFPDNFVNGSSSGPKWNFYDDFFFTTTGATVDAAVISINRAGLGVSNLQARIFTADGNPAPTLTALSTGSTLVDSWQNTSCGAASCVITLPTDFPAGNYDLQIRGLAASGGGSYGGDINFSAVPLPAAAWLLISGLAGLGGLARRKLT